MNRICVFCGSSMGFDKTYHEVAESLGKILASNHIELVYGGANVGLMQVLADSVLQNGGKVIGVMPKRIMEMNVTHNALSQLIVVDSMAERKSLMIDMSDAFVALPGGFGTLDEISEVLVLSQLRIADKPLALLNIRGYFDSLITFVNHAVDEGFVRAEHRDNLLVADNAEAVLPVLSQYQPVEVGKWISHIKEESKRN